MKLENQVLFIKRQFNQIRKEGLLSLLFKLEILVLLFPALIVLCILRIIKPFILVRFGKLCCERIGHFAINTELYLCERDAGMYNKRILDIFYYPYNVPISNHQLNKMWKRILPISHYAFILGKVNHLLPGYEAHTVQMPSDRDLSGVFCHSKAHLYFTAAEEKKGKTELRKLSISEDTPFVCFHIRDSAYLNTLYPGNNWSYHDYRNSSLQNNILAAEELSRIGYFVLRMGAVVKEGLKNDNPKIIDYAKILRNDFLDIYLCAKCKFFFASVSGFSAIPMIFRKPIAWVNFIPLEYFPTAYSDVLVIPKKIRDRKASRFMTFREIIDSGVGRFLEAWQYEKAGLDAVENTPEEIRALVIEMDARINGTWKNDTEDERLQQRFRSIFKQNELHGSTRSARIGTEFLKHNKELLG